MAQEVHGPDYDPSTEPIDPDVLMRVGGGKRHERYCNSSFLELYTYSLSYYNVGL
jgi:hypothetical protein